LTVTEKLCVALRMGEPLSATVRVNALVVLASVTVGPPGERTAVWCQRRLPGPLTRLKVRVCGGESVSVALAVKATVWPTLTVWLPIGDSTGGVLFGAGGINNSTMV